MERRVSRKPISVLCLAVCMALLWGAWRLVTRADEVASLPELQLFPFRSRSSPPSPRAPAKRPDQAHAVTPAEPMPLIRVGLSAEPAHSISIEVSEPFLVRPA